MPKLLRVAARILGPQLPLALGVLLLLGVLGSQRHHAWAAWISAIALGLCILVVPAIERACSAVPLRVDGLPDYREPIHPPRYWWVRLGVGLLVLLCGLIMAFGATWLLIVVTVVGGAILCAVAFIAAVRMQSHSADRRKIKNAVESYAPRFVFYTARRNDASYQLQMWIPLLEQLGQPYLVVVRHPEAIKPTRQVTKAPIISCPTTVDLDCVAVASVRTAFYVNMIAQNAAFVLYRDITHVYLGHGDSDKELSAHPGHGMFDRIFVAGPAAIDRYAVHGVTLAREKFVEVGRPQLAGIERATTRINEIPVPRVLLAPTWRGYNSKTNLSSLSAAKIIAEALISRGAEVVFRPHPFSWLGRAERAAISDVDTLLTAERSSSDRRHRLATECRQLTVRECFDISDACITDIGSVLVDYFATDKPYAVVLPRGEEAGCAHERFPTTGAAYLMELDDLTSSRAQLVLGRALDDLLGADPLAERRSDIAHYYLGAQPGDDAPFLDAARKVIINPT